MKLVILALLALATPTNAIAQTVTLDKQEYTANDPILVEYSGMPPTDGYNWISLSRPEARTDTDSYITWKKAEGGSGRLSFGPLKPGNYEIRGYKNWPDDGYVVRAQVPFRVVPPTGVASVHGGTAVSPTPQTAPSVVPTEPPLAELERRVAEQEGLSLGECRRIMQEQVRLALNEVRSDMPQLVDETPAYAARRQQCLDRHAHDERIKALALIGLHASNTWFGPGTAAPRGHLTPQAPTRATGPRNPAPSRRVSVRPNRASPPARATGEPALNPGRRYDPETANTVRTRDPNYRNLGDTLDAGNGRRGSAAEGVSRAPRRPARPFRGNPERFSTADWNRLQSMDGRAKAARGPRRIPAPGLTERDMNWLRQRQQENPDYFQFLRENLSPDFNVDTLQNAFINGGVPIN